MWGPKGTKPEEGHLWQKEGGAKFKLRSNVPASGSASRAPWGRKTAAWCTTGGRKWPGLVSGSSRCTPSETARNYHILLSCYHLK